MVPSQLANVNKCIEIDSSFLLIDYLPDGGGRSPKQNRNIKTQPRKVEGFHWLRKIF